jgi:hypothetical protein
MREVKTNQKWESYNSPIFLQRLRMSNAKLFTYMEALFAVIVWAPGSLPPKFRKGTYAGLTIFQILSKDASETLRIALTSL